MGLHIERAIGRVVAYRDPRCPRDGRSHVRCIKPASERASTTYVAHRCAQGRVQALRRVPAPILREALQGHSQVLSCLREQRAQGTLRLTASLRETL